MSLPRRAGASVLKIALVSAGALVVGALSLSACGGSESEGSTAAPSATSDGSADETSTEASTTDAAANSSDTSAEVVETTAASTTTIASTSSTVAPPEGLVAAIDGHNDLSADRINLILAPWGWDDLERFQSVASLYLGWDQRAQLVSDDGYPVTGTDRATFAQLGLFGFEPFRSNPDKFNIWITEVSPPGPAVWLSSDDLPFDLPDQSIVTLARDPDTEFPGISSVAGQDTAFVLQETPVRSGTDSVANAMVFVRGDFPASAMLDLPHELGHALFGLADEYVGRLGIEEPGEPRIDIWPSCAASAETAERWWGDLVGQYDPMVDVWADELRAAGFGYLVGDIEELRDTVRTAYVDGGCWGDPGSVRASEDSLMGFNQPAFGLTNRRSAERILELWEG